jgi:hypothetical protein
VAADRSKLARDLMYCGSFRMAMLQLEPKGGTPDAAVASTRDFLSMAVVGLELGNVNAMAAEVKEQIKSDTKAASDRRDQDPDAMKKFIAETKARCDPLLASEAVAAAHKRGLAITEAQRAKKTQ